MPRPLLHLAVRLADCTYGYLNKQVQMPWKYRRESDATAACCTANYPLRKTQMCALADY